jgi:ABC-type sugar transport system substrate-binding protein
MFKKLFVLLTAVVAATIPVRAAEKEVKIGFISAFTGVFSSFGQQQKEGAVLALEEANYTAGGDKINVIYEDDQLDNEQAVTKAKKLVIQDKIDILTGLVSGDEGLSVGDYMKDKNIPVVPMDSASEDMTMRAFYPINKGLWTVKNVGQFGPYDPQLYLKQPSDSGSYPPDNRSNFPGDMLKGGPEYQYLPFGQ